MRATMSLDGVLAFIHSLSLSTSNKRWLGEKLLNEAQQEASSRVQSYDEFINSMCGAWNDDPRTTEEIMDDIHNARQFNVTRHVLSLNADDK